MLSLQDGVFSFPFLSSLIERQTKKKKKKPMPRWNHVSTETLYTVYDVKYVVWSCEELLWFKRPEKEGLEVGRTRERLKVSFWLHLTRMDKDYLCLQLLALADRSTLTSCCGNTWPTAADTNKGLTSSSTTGNITGAEAPAASDGGTRVWVHANTWEHL